MANEQPNTVAGHPEPAFRAAWLSIQWRAMARTGKGYPRQKAPTRKQRAADEAREKREQQPQTPERPQIVSSAA